MIINLPLPCDFFCGHFSFRLIQALFPQDPEFRGRRVVTFHNQRDFIFFRHHRYASIFAFLSVPVKKIMQLYSLHVMLP